MQILARVHPGDDKKFWMKKKSHFFQRGQWRSFVSHPDEFDDFKAGTFSRRLCPAPPTVHFFLEANQVSLT
jgi:hypothetical protein